MSYISYVLEYFDRFEALMFLKKLKKSILNKIKLTEEDIEKMIFGLNCYEIDGNILKKY